MSDSKTVTARASAAHQPAWLNAEERRAWLALGEMIVKLPGALESQLQRDSGLSLYGYMVLSAASEQPGGTIVMSELAAATGGSISRLSHIAKRLEAQGYLCRARDPANGRQITVTLTDAGRAKVVAAATMHVG